MKTIWVIERQTSNYFEEVEQRLFPVKHWHTEEVSDKGYMVECHHSNLDEYYKHRKTIFENREQAEKYAWGIAEEAYKFWLSDMKANNDDGYNDEFIRICEKRGLQKIRSDELTEDKDGDRWECYAAGYERPITHICVPADHEDDKNGHYFVGIKEETLY